MHLNASKLQQGFQPSSTHTSIYIEETLVCRLVPWTGGPCCRQWPAVVRYQRPGPPAYPACRWFAVGQQAAAAASPSVLVRPVTRSLFISHNKLFSSHVHLFMLAFSFTLCLLSLTLVRRWRTCWAAHIRDRALSLFCVTFQVVRVNMK